MTETLVLIPGFANNGLAWKHQIEQLSSLFNPRVIVMDPYVSRHEMVDAILNNAPSHFFLAGHSMGGWIAQAVAAAAPKRVAKLILLNTWATADPKMIYLQQQIADALKHGKLAEVMQQHISLLLHPSRQKDEALLLAMQAMVTSFPIETLIRQLEAMLLDYSSQHLHPAIDAPTLVVHSHDDALFPAKELQAIATGIKNSELEILQETGHASILEKPQEVTQLMQSFLSP